MIIIKKLLLSIIICTLSSFCVSCATQEEIQRAEQERNLWREQHTYRMEVISVNKYIKTTTNNFGAVLNQEPVYTFTYKTNEGIKTVDEFTDSPYGLEHVTIGDCNAYIIIDGESNRTLQLTEDTFKRLGNIN